MTAMRRRALLLGIGLLCASTPAARALETVIPPSAIGHFVSGDTIADALLRSLRDRTQTGHVELHLDAPLPRLVALSATDPELDVDQLSFDARSGRISAFVGVADATAGGQRVRVAGKVVRMVDLPVLARIVNPGETIGEGDVVMTAFRSDRIGPNLVTERSALVGKTPRSVIRPEEPVHGNEIATPLAVHKGDLVTLILRTPSLMLTAQGKAVEDAAQGAPVRVANAKSGRVIDGMVSGPNTVSIAVPVVLSP